MTAGLLAFNNRVHPIILLQFPKSKPTAGANSFASAADFIIILKRRTARENFPAAGNRLISAESDGGEDRQPTKE